MLKEVVDFLLVRSKFWRERGGAMVEALSYKPEDRGIDSRWCQWNLSLT
jgi:hypothetical protein